MGVECKGEQAGHESGMLELVGGERGWVGESHISKLSVVAFFKLLLNNNKIYYICVLNYVTETPLQLSTVKHHSTLK